MLSTYARYGVFVKRFVISYARALVQFTIHVMGVLGLCSFTVGCRLGAVGFISLKLDFNKISEQTTRRSNQCSD
jgi:hypothetical protein